MDTSTTASYTLRTMNDSISWNTTDEPHTPKDISRTVQVIFTVILCFVMFGVGCAGDFTSIFSHFRRPAGICTGIFNQFVIMPLLALALTYATSMSHIEAMAVLIQGTSPGGMMSNIFTYWMEGDINLSIAMTALSTLIALGSMPLWLFIFTHILQVKDEHQIPFDALGIALAAMVIPVALGAIMRKYKPKPAGVITKVFTIVGTIAIIVALIVTGVISELEFKISWRQWVVAFLTPICGIFLGYLIASLPFLKLDNKCRRTVAVETGMQNCQISQSVLVISYAGIKSVYEEVRLYPLLTSFFQIMYGVCFAIIVARCIHVKKLKKQKARDEAKADEEEEEGLNAV